MEYDKKKIEEGLHELMKMRIGNLEEAIKKTSETTTISTPQVYDALKTYSEANTISSTIIDTSGYVTKSIQLLLQGFENLKKPLDRDYISKKLAELNLSVRARKILTRMKLLESPIADLAQKTEIDVRSIKGAGDLTFNELRGILTLGGLDFKYYKK